MNWHLIYTLAVVIGLLSLSSCSNRKYEHISEVADATFDSIKVDSMPIPVKAPPKVPSAIELAFREAGLVNVMELDSGFLLDIRYSTTNNFIGVDVYQEYCGCYLQPEAADKLVKAQHALTQKHPGYRLLLFDCARPRSVQQRMWDSLDIPYKRNYLAPPWEGSVHNYGAAVDLSIADSVGKPLDMGTDFDYFGALAQPQLETQLLKEGKLSQHQANNRILLREVMRAGGFYKIHTEWWHFQAFLTGDAKQRYKIIE